MTDAAPGLTPKLRPRSDLKASLALLGSAACWGLAAVMSRDLLSGMTAPTLLVIQLTASVATLLAMARAQPPWRFRSRAFAKASSFGVLEPGLTFALALAGLSLTTAGSATIIGAAEPLLIVAMSWILFRQVPSRRLLVCIGVAVIGLALVSSEAWTGSAGSSLTGNLLVFLGTTFAALYVVLSSRVAADFPAATLAAAQQAVGLVFAILVFGVLQALGLDQQDWHILTLPQVGYAALSGIVQYALAFWLYLIGLKSVSANAAGLWLALVPLFGLSGAYLWLEEVPTLPMLAGAGLIVGAVAAYQRRP